MAVEFLPFDQQLHLVVADADMNLQVLQFDPDSTFLLGGRWGAHYLAIFSIPSLHLLFSLFPSPKQQITDASQIRNQKLVPACCTNPPSTPATSPHPCISSNPTSPYHQQPIPSRRTHWTMTTTTMKTTMTTTTMKTPPLLRPNPEVQKVLSSTKSYTHPNQALSPSSPH